MNRKTYTKEFKAKVALEAIKNEKTLSELASEFEIHSNQIVRWKSHLLAGVNDLFDKPGKKKKASNGIGKEEDLYKHIGQLKVENEFLKKKYRQIYGQEPSL